MPCRSRALHMCSTWHMLVLSCHRCQEWLSCTVPHVVGPGLSELVSVTHTLPVVLVAVLVCLMTDNGAGPTWCLALITSTTIKGSKNVFHKNKSRCRDGAKCLQRTHVPAWKNQLAEKLQEQGGIPFHAQQSRLTFSSIKDTLDTCSPSLHLATSVVVYMHML